MSLKVQIKNIISTLRVILSSFLLITFWSSCNRAQVAEVVESRQEYNEQLEQGRTQDAQIEHQLTEFATRLSQKLLQVGLNAKTANLIAESAQNRAWVAYQTLGQKQHTTMAIRSASQQDILSALAPEFTTGGLMALPPSLPDIQHVFAIIAASFLESWLQVVTPEPGIEIAVTPVVQANAQAAMGQLANRAQAGEDPVAYLTYLSASLVASASLWADLLPQAQNELLAKLFLSLHQNLSSLRLDEIGLAAATQAISNGAWQSLLVLHPIEQQQRVDSLSPDLLPQQPEDAPVITNFVFAQAQSDLIVALSSIDQEGFQAQNLLTLIPQSALGALQAMLGKGEPSNRQFWQQLSWGTLHGLAVLRENLGEFIAFGSIEMSLRDQVSVLLELYLGNQTELASVQENLHSYNAILVGHYTLFGIQSGTQIVLDSIAVCLTALLHSEHGLAGALAVVEPLYSLWAQRLSSDGFSGSEFYQAMEKLQQATLIALDQAQSQGVINDDTSDAQLNMAKLSMFGLPRVQVEIMSFVDTNPASGIISGSLSYRLKRVVSTENEDETNIDGLLAANDHLILYQGQSSEMRILDIGLVTQIAAQGDSTSWQIEIDNLPLLDGASHLLLYIANDQGLSLFPASLAIVDQKQLMPPTIRPLSGSYSDLVSVSLTTDNNAGIFYSLDGSDPQCGPNQIYSHEFTLEQSSTLKAIACSQDGEASQIQEQHYTIVRTLSTVRLSPEAGIYQSPQQLALSAEPAEAEIWYTSDGSTPLCGASLRYNEPIVLSLDSRMDIKALACLEGWTPSAIFSGSVVVTGQLETVQISPPAGYYNRNLHLSLSTSRGASIYYSLDGSQPQCGSLLYEEPLTIVVSSQLRTIACKDSWLDSMLASADYVLDFQAPQLLDLQPANGSDSVAVDSQIQLVFNEPMLGLNAQNVILSGSSGLINIDLTLSNNQTLLGLSPVNPPTNVLDFDHAYELILADGISDLSGNALTGQRLFLFQTESIPSRLLQAAYLCDGSVQDSSGNNFDAEYAIGVFVHDRFARSASACSIQASEQRYLTVADDPSFNNQQFSIAFWLRLDAKPDGEVFLMGKEDIDNALGFSLRVGTDSFIFNVHGQSLIVADYTDLDLTSWHFISLVYDGDNYQAKLAIDKDHVFSSQIQTSLQTSSKEWRIGLDEHGVGMAGSIDDLRLYSRALRDDEIAAIYHEKNWVAGWQLAGASYAAAISGIETATVEFDKQAYIFGGQASGLAQKTTLLFDPLTKSWSALEAMSQARSGASAINLNGKIYVIGGRDVNFSYSDSMEIYDPLTGSWSAGSPRPRAAAYAAIASAAGKIYVFGGENSAGLLDQIDVYETEQESWHSLQSSLPSPSKNDSAWSVSDRIFITNSGLRKFYEFVISDQSFAVRSDPLNWSHSAASAQQGQTLFLLGGLDSMPLAAVQAYDIQSDQWRYLAGLPKPMFSQGALATPDALCSLLGQDGDGRNINQAFCLDLQQPD